MKICVEETIYEGSGTEILDQLRSQTFCAAEFPDTDSYIRFVQENLSRTADVECVLPNKDTETRARTLLYCLAKTGALELLEDE